ncbi:hypothetical protein GCM10018783_16720 [Streptomyces griseosporeus]|nr:hypothetical protein GCM10018783_16720 [Streptomyces griseosporeus]
MRHRCPNHLGLRNRPQVDIPNHMGLEFVLSGSVRSLRAARAPARLRTRTSVMSTLEAQ